MRELGKVSSEVQAFIKDKAQSAVGNLGKFFEYLAKQEELTSEQAEAALTQMSGAFQAAVQATGSLSGAVAMLGPAFGTLLEKMRATLGDQNQLLNSMTQYYNFVSANQEQLAAIDALSQGFKDLLSLGIINASNINEFAASFKTQFESMLAATDDQATALAAMGPQLGQLLEAYREMGVAVPGWLQDMAQKAKEAGASLAPPEGLPDILKDIRDIMLSIADAMGAASRGAKDFARNMDGVNAPKGGGDYDYGSAQSGMFKKLKKDTLIFAHAGEFAAIVPKGMNFVSARRGFMEEQNGETTNASNYVAPPPILPGAGDELGEKVATATAPVKEARTAQQQDISALSETVAKLAEQPPQVVQPVVNATANVNIDTAAIDKNAVESLNDLMVPQLLKSFRMNIRGVTDQLAESLKGRL